MTASFTPADFLDLAITITYGLLILALILIIVRLVRGPTLPDRVLALDTLLVVGISFILVATLSTQFYQYLDVALALGLVGFLTTVAFARFVMYWGRRHRGPGTCEAEQPDPADQVVRSGLE